MCRTCNTIKKREYRSTAKGRAAVKKAVAKYESRNQLRKKAWSLAQKIDKKSCEVCGDSSAHRHHPDIAKPMYVIFLCPLHHKQAHLEKVVV